MRFKLFAVAIALFVAGIVCGGYLFSKSEPRSFLAFKSCQNRCLNQSEIIGLTTSAAILRAPFLFPGVVLESDTCLAIRSPRPEAAIHYVLFPKHDTRNIATVTTEDSPYILGCLALARELISRDKLTAYRLYTNGPDYQEIAFLHFHLVANKAAEAETSIERTPENGSAHIKR